MLETIAIIGGGKMGEAIGAGWIAAKTGPAATLGPESLIFVEPNAQRRAALEQAHGVRCLADSTELPEVDLGLLAVKPQVMFEVLESLPSFPLTVSIAAGLSTERLESALAPHSRLVRVMPNLPLQVGAGASAVTGGQWATPDDVELVLELFSSLGVAVQVDESLMDTVCAISGSGPAYVAWMIECLRDAGVEQGLDAGVAQELALQTVFGTASVLRATGQPPEEFRRAVCSPGGTTLAALDAMGEAGFSKAIDAGVKAAIRRSIELGS